jgi:hypothetical protein
LKFERTTYAGSPNWRLTGRWIYFDAEWNTRWPFGICMCLRLGPAHPWPEPGSEHRQAKRGFTLDLNAPLGEPNRLYLWGARREYMIGLVSWWTFRETGREGRVIQGDHVRCRPHLVRGQAWDWKRDEARDWRRDDSWRWLVIHPSDWRDRWARAHPEEAAAGHARQNRTQATYVNEPELCSRNADSQSP